MITMSRTLILFVLASSVLLLSAATPMASDDFTSAEKELLALFKSKLTVSAPKTKKGIDRSSLPAAAMKTSSHEYLETYGPQAGKTFTRTVKPTRTYPKEWPVSSKGAVTDTVPGDYVFYEILDDKRGVIAPVELDLHSSVQVAYEPGEIMVPNSDKVAPYDIKVLVYDLTNPTSVKHSGQFKVTTVDRGQWSVKTPAGTFDCVMFTITYDGKVGPASVKDTAIIFVSPDHGVIAKVTRNKVSAFLVYNADDKLAFVLNKMPAK